MQCEQMDTRHEPYACIADQRAVRVSCSHAQPAPTRSRPASNRPACSASPHGGRRPLYSSRERAALALTDAVTKLGEHGVSDDVWAGAKAEFDERELVYLVSAIAMINYWNRMAITFQSTAGERRGGIAGLNAHVGGMRRRRCQRAAANGLAPRTRPGRERTGVLAIGEGLDAALERVPVAGRGLHQAAAACWQVVHDRRRVRGERAHVDDVDVGEVAGGEHATVQPAHVAAVRWVMWWTISSIGSSRRECGPGSTVPATWSTCCRR